METAHIDGLLARLAGTARVSDLLARNFYKSRITDKISMFEPYEYIIMANIKKYPDLSQAELSKLVYKGKAHMGKILNEMERKNYIKRVLNTKDNMMVKHTVITPYGMKLFQKTETIFKDMEAGILDVFTPAEITEFERLLDKLRNRILETDKIVF